MTTIKYCHYFPKQENNRSHSILPGPKVISQTKVYLTCKLLPSSDGSGCKSDFSNIPQTLDFVPLKLGPYGEILKHKGTKY